VNTLTSEITMPKKPNWRPDTGSDNHSSIVKHPLWESTLKECFRIEVYDRDGGHTRPRVRIEVKVPSPELGAIFDTVVMPCVACGKEIHPIRARNMKSGSSHRYYAPCCPLDVNVGCSRGAASREEYKRVKAELRPDLAEET
jgi:hypothetical protein